jgi:hypothetical protein
MGLCAGDGDLAGLERLPQGFQARAGEFRQFVEEQHAAMGEADLAGLTPPAALKFSKFLDSAPQKASVSFAINL